MDRASTGIVGLDDVLGGGLPAHRMYLVQGTPGVGKTTLALQFLLAGVAKGERALYVTLSETREEIEQIAASHGWSLEGLDLFELSVAEQALQLDAENTLYATEDVELKETLGVVLAEADRVKPARIAFDSLSEIRVLAQSPGRYRRQILSLKQRFVGRSCTVLLLDDRAEEGDLHVESLSHGVIVLQQRSVGYGADRRRLRVTKLRGATFRSGHHDYVIDKGGIEVFPRLVAAEHRTRSFGDPLATGVAAFDALLGGGLDRATSALIMGPAGTGKSLIATQIVCAAAQRGENATMFLFEERLGTLRARSKALGLDIDNPKIHIQQVDPAELAPDQFSHLVRAAVEEQGARVVVIDSINGYFTAMPEAHHLTLQMHELLSFLAERGVAGILTLAQSGLMGSMSSPIDVSYLADTVLLLRYFEASGRVRKAISVLKKRSGMHEDTIRELVIGRGGITLGQPLTEFRGVLTGVPTYEGHATELLRKGGPGDAAR